MHIYSIINYYAPLLLTTIELLQHASQKNCQNERHIMCLKQEELNSHLLTTT